MVHVPYRQSTQAMADMLAGRVHARCLGLPEGEAVRGAPTVRPVALTTPQRRPEWPGVPAMAETIPGYEASAYFGLAVPSRTPPEAVQRLNEALCDALRDDRVRAAYARVGADAAAPNTPADFAAHARRDGERWGAMIRHLNLAAE
jgi:tripartite-type tricarboxylate transporter receptor subunit TctC